MLFQSAPPVDMTPFLCGIGFTGFAGCCLLLFVAIRMYREEQDRRNGIVNAPKPPRDPNEPTAMQKAAQWVMGAAKVAAETTAKATSSVANTAANAASAAAASRATPSDAYEAMRLLRDKLTGRLIVEIAGKRYTRLMEIQDATIGQAFLTTVRDLNRFASGQTPPPAPLPSTGVQLNAPTPPPAAPPVATAAPPPAYDIHASALPPEQQPPLRMPSMNPFRQMATLREMEKAPAPAPKSITEQIDEVLQTQLAGTPFITRGMKVGSDLAGNALFFLDGQTYDAVDNIPDTAVREVIRAAIKEWEKGQ